MARWELLRIGADYDALSRELNIDPVVVRIMRNRGLTTIEEMRKFLTCEIFVCHACDGLPDVDRAVAVLENLKRENKKIRIIGDYDVDGICASAILYKGLTRFGLRVDNVIPNRVVDGYGVNEHLIAQAFEDKVDAIITCDNGISACEVLEKAEALGMTVIVTDHHEVHTVVNEQGLVKENLPKVTAVIDPKRSDSTYESKEICGAYVAYKLIAKLLNLKDEADSDFTKELLALAGFATVGDLMPLTGENRNLVTYALRQLQEGKNFGLKVLMDKTNLTDKKLSAYHIGFVLAPCLNAMGRLDYAGRSLELLLCEKQERAEEIARELVQINETRKEMTVTATEAGIAKVEESYMEDKVLVVYLPECHESIAGIVAGRIKERFYKPTLVFTDASEGIKGSGRSVEAYNMFEELSACQELFTKFGGHKMAAGFSMESKEKLELLRCRLNEQTELTEADLTEVVYIDVDLPFGYVSDALMEDLGRLEPCGMGNRKPIFAQRGVVFCGARMMGVRQNVLMIRVKDGSQRMYDLKYFGDIPAFNRYLDYKHGEGSASALYSNQGSFPMNVIYKPEWNVYQDRRSLQFIMQDYK